MIYSVLVSALVVCPAIAIVLPNGFVFDETAYLNLEARATNVALEKCDRPYDGCSNDCSTQFLCDGNYNVQVSQAYQAYQCSSSVPYCVKKAGMSSMCSGNFPMTNQACWTRAMNNFVCTDDGHFPDPTDCSKYHVCNGTSHHIEECLASHKFWTVSVEDPYVNQGNGEFACRFRIEYEACMCEKFSCDGYANSFTFRSTDYHHYAYCFEMGTLKKTIMFKCPSGTSHNGFVTGNMVECLPPIV